MGVKYTRRGVLFGAEGNLSLRSDFTEEEVTDGIVEFAGTPVPVVFGTRYVIPVVTGWEGRDDFITKFYRPQTGAVTETRPTRQKRDNDGMIQTDENGQPILEADPFAVRMTVLTMRWVLCLGAEAYISRLQMDNHIIHIRPERLPRTSFSDSRRFFDEARGWQNAGAARFIVAEQDSDVFGGGESGGLGYPYSRHAYHANTKLSEFWLTAGYPGMPTHEIIDRFSPAKNVVSLYFDNFNFGGKRPIPKARVALTRVRLQTTVDDDGDPISQWETIGNLHVISQLRAPNVNPYYLIVLDSTLEKAQREQVKRYLMSLPYDESGTQYHIIRASYYIGSTRQAEVVETVLTEDGDREQTQRNLLEERLDRYISEAGTRSPTIYATNFDKDLAETIVKTYADHMYSVHNRRNSRAGVVALFLTDMFIASDNNRDTVSVNLFHTQAPLNLLLYPSVSAAGDNGAFPTANQIEGLKRFQPEVHLTLFQYIDTDGPYRYRINPRYRATLPSNIGYTYLFDWDTDTRITVGGGFASPDSVDSFYNRFQVAREFGYTMNPIHALREALTNPDWGEGVPEEKINQASFKAAAEVCKKEGLDYCYVHKTLGGVDRLVTGITDYIDAMVWYDGYTDSVRIQLIREDYDITNLPTYDESTIAGIENYRRMNSNEVTNSVTVKYHDAALGADEVVTVHDMEASFRSGGVRSETFNYDGCATLTAAVRVADRELTSLSRSVITFTAKLYTGDDILGLGDPIVISYRDLGLKSIVMRVTRILYGDGTTGGISVDLVQDVFADLSLFGDVVEVEPYLTVNEAPPFVRLDSEVSFLEQGYFDLTGTTPFSNPHNRWLKAGVRYNSDLTDDAYVAVESVTLNPSIGRLLTDIQPLNSDPRSQGLWVQVMISPDPSGDEYVRIGDEIFYVERARKIADDIHELLLTRRAERDTVATRGIISHGTDVWFLDRLWVDSEVWDGSRVHALFQSGVHGDTELLDPDVDFIGRGNRPLPPAYVSVDNMFGDRVRTDGSFVIRWLPRRSQFGIFVDTEVVLDLSYNGTSIFTTRVNPSTINGQIVEGRANISRAELTAGVPSGAGLLQLTVESVWQGRKSWQKWVMDIEWSLIAPPRCGWDFDWGADWGGTDCGGFGRKWSEAYSR